ncbi:hypothetical protein B0H21DRAFT_771594 [Amylocystis lapponica]|nr:hypothetical protein B0H21DRAFT_771594 [Amylocystis lapponica]
MNLNNMMHPSGVWPNMFHPRMPSLNRNFKGFARHLTRTERPTKYYLIDFGLSLHFNAEETRTARPILGGDKSVPEFRDRIRRSGPQDPFPTDVYYIRNLVREDFLQRFNSLDFLDSMVADMVHSDPTKRPNMDEVVARLFPLMRSGRS